MDGNAPNKEGEKIITRFKNSNDVAPYQSTENQWNKRKITLNTEPFWVLKLVT